MITLLRRLFIKNYQNVEDENVRKNHGMLAAIFGIISNLILVCVKVAAAIIISANAGWTFFPIALLADAINNTSDAFTSIVTLVSFKIAAKPGDKEHPFGHERVEYIASMIVSFFIIVVAVEIFKSSLEKVISSEIAEYDILSVVILALAIVLKFIQSHVNRSIGKIINSPALKATALDSLLDCLVTGVVLACALLTWGFGWTFLDGYFGMAVAVFVFISGVRSLLESFSPLIGEANNEELVEKITAIVNSNEKVLGIHDMICHSYGPTKSFVSFHIEVNSKMSLEESHDVADTIEERIRAELKVEANIHVDPVDLDDPEIVEARNTINEVIRSFDPEGNCHDVRIVRGTKAKTLRFDILVLTRDKKEQARITKAIQDEFEKKGRKYVYKINIDHPF
ncbi:MAG: cation diffusion facilitator family transporter [Bacilli bacterium]|nr:cation diffusion facilitator family transporter [Bacilli bacterium]